jgi:hypothetical protein
VVRLKKGGAVTAKIIALGLARTANESASEAGIHRPELRVPVGDAKLQVSALAYEIIRKI